MVTDVDGPGKEPVATPFSHEHERTTQERLAPLMAALRTAGVDVDAIMADDTVRALIYDGVVFAAGPDHRPHEGGAGETRSARNMGAGKSRDSTLERILSAAGLAELGVSEAVFTVMMEAIHDMDDDIRLIMAEIRAMSRVKQKLRKHISDLNQWISREMSKHPDSNNLDREKVTGESPGGLFKVSGEKVKYKKPRPDIEDADLVVEYPTVYDLEGGVTTQGLDSLREDLKGGLDNSNQMSEMTSLRLQMTMDRRTKFISMLSQIMKKIATTQDTLVQNIK